MWRGNRTECSSINNVTLRFRDLSLILEILLISSKANEIHPSLFCGKSSLGRKNEVTLLDFPARRREPEKGHQGTGSFSCSLSLSYHTATDSDEPLPSLCFDLAPLAGLPQGLDQSLIDLGPELDDTA